MLELGRSRAALAQANTLAKYQPVVIYVSPRDVTYMQSLLSSSVETLDFSQKDFRAFSSDYVGIQGAQSKLIFCFLPVVRA